MVVEGAFNSDAGTLRGALGIVADSPNPLPYYIGSEPAACRATRQKPGPYVPATAADARLDGLAGDVAAGVPDATLARRAEVTVSAVQRWRKRRGLSRRRGRPPNAVRLTTYAVDIFGRDPAPVAMEVSPVRGKWEPPEYLLRQQLDYTAFVDIVGILRSDGLAVVTIARGLGVRERDVTDAAALCEARR